MDQSQELDKVKAENERLREILRQAVAMIKKQGEQSTSMANYMGDVLENRRLDSA